MDLKGGYVIIDCTGLDLGNLGKVDGLYKKVKDAIAVNKPIVLRNVVNSAQHFTPIVAFGSVESSTSIFLSFFPTTIHIANTDIVTE